MLHLITCHVRIMARLAEFLLCNNSDRTCFFQCINIRKVPWEVLKTAASGLGFQHLPRDLANVNA